MKAWTCGWLLFCSITGVCGAQQSAVSQWGITFSFAAPHEVGQYANGDYWVVGPVTITSISPPAAAADLNNGVVDAVCTGGSTGIGACRDWCADNAPGGYSSACLGGGRGLGLCHCQRIRNGWQVNPLVLSGQAFDDRSTNVDAGLVPSLPFTAVPGQSIVKSISLNPDEASCRPCLRTAAVLTVVAEAPPDGGSTVFRPPYVGAAKTLYSVNDVRTDLLPSLAPVPLAISDDFFSVKLEWVHERYRKVQLDHMGGLCGRSTHPEEHMPNYGADIGSNNGDAVLRLCLNESLEEKLPGLIAFIQYGIDLHRMVELGQTWPAGGGHRPGQLLPLTFAALMLDDAAMRNNLKSPTDGLILHEMQTMAWSERAQRALYGYVQHTGPDDYWDRLLTQSSGAKSMLDMYGYIDGGYTPGGNYQDCCTSQPWKGEALCWYLIPQLFSVWHDPVFFGYVERWVNHGVWTQPDPCAPLDQGGWHDHDTDFCVLDPDLAYFNSPTDFGCSPGAECGRFPKLHGTKADGGGRMSRFQAQMWDEYRSRFLFFDGFEWGDTRVWNSVEDSEDSTAAPLTK